MKQFLLTLLLPALLLAGCTEDNGGDGDTQSQSSSYNITVYHDDGGAAQANENSAEAGETIKLTASVTESGYTFKRWQIVSGGANLSFDTNANPTTFTMPANAVTIKAVFASTLYVTTDHNGSVKAVPSKALPGTSVKITATPVGDYRFKEWVIVMGNNSLLADKTANPATFTMPEGDVEIEAVFEAITRLIDITVSGNGTVEATVDGEVVTEAAAGSTVTLTAIPGSGPNLFKQWSVTSGGISLSPDMQTNTVTFKMPMNEVGVNVEFIEGVVINGLTWATRNVDAPGTFAATPESFSMYYQWSRNTGWSLNNGKVVSSDGTTWDESYVKASTWSESKNPCPEGWRVPTRDEMGLLIDENFVNSGWTTQNSVDGYKFTDIATGGSIFLPAMGMLRGHPNATGEIEEGDAGFYWTATAAPTLLNNDMNELIFAANLQSPLYPGGAKMLSIGSIQSPMFCSAVRCVLK